MSPLDVRSADDRQLWDSYVERDTRASFFHQWGYQEVVRRTFGHRSHYLIATQDGDAAGILPLVHVKSRLFGKFLVSLPFADYGGICAVDDRVGAALLNEAVRVATVERAEIIELRHRHASSLDLPCRFTKVNLWLPLPTSADRAWSHLDSNLRKAVRKAEKSGLEFVTCGRERLDEFYRVWSQNMRDLGTPAYPRSFFAHFLDVFGDQSELLLVTQAEEAVGACVAIYFKDTIEIPWISSLRNHFALRPNNLLYWGAIKRGIERGCREFHFGRSTKGSGNYRFKKQWGAEDQQLFYQYHLLGRTSAPDLDPHGRKYRLAVDLWRRLPLSIANRLGPPIARGIP